MFINQKHISKYNARLLSRFIEPINFQNEMLTPDGSLNSIVYDTKLGRKRLVVSIEFYGLAHEILDNRSRLTKEFLDNPSISFRAIPNRFFEGYVESMSIGEQNYLFETLDASFTVVEKGESLIRNFTNNVTIDIYSTMETPVVIEITPQENADSLTISGFEEEIAISNVTAGKAITIDSEYSIVIEEGVNKFPDYNSWGFPRLKVGRNNISVSGNNNVRILYSPRWL